MVPFISHSGLNKQWRNNPGLWAIPFTEFVAGGITMTRTGSQSSGTWYGDSGTISLTGYTASCATNESWVSSISGSAISSRPLNSGDLKSIIILIKVLLNYLLLLRIVVM